MIVVMAPGFKEEQLEKVIDKLKELGFGTHLSRGVERTIIGAIGDKKNLEGFSLEAMEGVEKVVPISQPFKLAGKEFRPEPSVVEVGPGVAFGGNEVVVMAGPCAVESEEQLMEAARAVKEAGAKVLRGGAFKPRTSPYSFQGLEEKGLEILARAREETGLLIITEVLDQRSVELVEKYTDIFQIGARNMQNFYLLREVGRTEKPVLLKRGLASTIEEWLMAAEYIMSAGNHQVIMCERGIRTYETYTRNTLDLSAVPALKELSHLPVVVDPSHGTGKWKLVPAMAKAAVAAGADGLLIEVHPNPDAAVSDGPQSLNPERFSRLMEELAVVGRAVGRTVGEPGE